MIRDRFGEFATVPSNTVSGYVSALFDEGLPTQTNVTGVLINGVAAVLDTNIDANGNRSFTTTNAIPLGVPITGFLAGPGIPTDPPPDPPAMSQVYEVTAKTDVENSIFVALEDNFLILDSYRNVYDVSAGQTALVDVYESLFRAYFDSYGAPDVDVDRVTWDYYEGPDYLDSYAEPVRALKIGRYRSTSFLVGESTSFYPEQYQFTTSISFRAPRQYDTNTTVIFTFEGMDDTLNLPADAEWPWDWYMEFGPSIGTRDLSQIKYLGRNPIAWDNDAKTVSYLITVDGGREYTIGQDSFEWPVMTNCICVPDILPTYSTETLHMLTWTNFHNAHPEIDIVGLDQNTKRNPGGLVVCNCDTNSPPRVQVTIQHLTNTLGSVSLALTIPSQIKVFTASNNTTEVTSGATFSNANLPTNLWVEGESASTSMRDVKLSVAATGASNASDYVNFTVLWVTIQGNFSASQHVSDDNAAKQFYVDQTVPTRDTLGPGQFVDRMGWGCEFVGNVQPPALTNLIKMSRDGEARTYEGLGGTNLDATLHAYFPNIPPGSDDSQYSARDDSPQSGGSNGKVYDWDDPGVTMGLSDPVGAIRRNRANFNEFAVYKGERCSALYPWYCKVSYTKTGSSAQGIATGGSTSTLTDTNQAWATDQWKYGSISIVGGTGGGQWAVITGNSATTITISPAWALAPDNTSAYYIRGINAWSAVNDVQGDNNASPGGPIPLGWNLQ